MKKLKLSMFILLLLIGVFSCKDDDDKTVHVAKVELDKQELSIEEGSSISLKSHIVPESATNKHIDWHTTNEEIVTVKDGLIQAHKPGDATISAVAEDRDITAKCLVHVTKKVIKVSSVSLDKKEIEMVEGSKTKLVATILPKDASDKTIAWTSSDEKIASVKDGEITAIKVGEAIITVTTKDGSKVAACKIVIKAKTIAVTSISLNKKELEIIEGGKESLTASILPENASDKTVIWASSDEKVASVKDGEITGIKVGTANISATTKDGKKVATCKVSVKTKIIAVTSITLNKKELEIIEGGKESLTASILPENASDKTVIWASSDEKVASVKDGEITGIKVGTANISATTKDGKKVATCKVSVKTKIVIINVKSISLNKTSVSLEEGSKTILTATVLPENASDKTVIWTSADDKIASVKDGEISGIKAGETSITASTKDGNKIATCKVSVSAPIVNVSGVYLNKYNLDLEIGGTYTLVPKVLPSSATNKKVKWTSDNTKVASVVDGKVTAIAAGKATITVSSEDGNKTSTCSVNVKAKEVSVSSVSLDKTKLELRDGDKTQLIATILPEDASNKKLKWTSSNKNIATVVSDGTIYAEGIGECIITVTTLDGAKTATCNLVVKKKIKHVNFVSIDEISYKVPLNETKQITYTINPSDADNKEVKWTSSNPEIASIDEKGLVKAIKVGKTTITLTSVDGEKKNTCTVEVVDGVTHATSIVIYEDDFTLSIGDSKNIYASVKPFGVTNKSVKWSSDKPEVASVEDGTIKGLSAGVATITATSVDGGFTDDIKVTVVDGAISVSSISLSNTNMNLQTGDTKILTASILPETASNKNLIWKSSDENIISFKKAIYPDMSIELTAKAIGNAEITVTSEDGNFTATCSINVKGETVVTEGSVNIKGRDYKTVTINGKTWLAENYAYLPKVNKEKDLSNDEARVYVLQYDGEDLDEAKASENYKKYGALYNYKAAIEYCPEGWHLATNEDWKELEKEAGMNEEDLNRIGRDRGQCADKFKSTDFRGKNTFKLNILESGSIRFSSFSDFGGYIGCYNTIEDKYMYRAFSSYSNTIDAAYLYNKSAVAIRYVKD